MAAGAQVSASISLGDRPPEFAVDGDVETGWGAGAGPEQWIELDLGQEYELVCVRLHTNQFPAGRTTHRINGGAHDNPGAELGVIDSETEYGEWLELAGHLERRVPPDNHRGKPLPDRMVGDRGLGRADRAMTPGGQRASRFFSAQVRTAKPIRMATASLATPPPIPTVTGPRFSRATWPKPSSMPA